MNRRPFLYLMFCLFAGLQTGCISILSQADPPSEERIELARHIPRYARAEVHIFLITGGDPLQLSNMESVAEHLRKLGFGKVYCGMRKHVFAFYKEMACLRREHPEARFILVGYDVGAEMALRLSHYAAEDHQQISQLILLDPVTTSTQCWHPSLLASDLKVYQSQNPPDFTPPFDLEIQSIPSSHIGLPTAEQTVQILRESVESVANGVPLTRHLPIDKPLVEPVPEPRRGKVIPKDEIIRDWDFLRSRVQANPNPTQDEEIVAPRKNSVTPVSQQLIDQPFAAK